MNELEKLLNKYRRMAGNIRWHLKTNQPTDKMEIKKCNQQIEDYEQVERDLISLVAQFTPQSVPVSETTGQVGLEALKQIEQMSDCGDPLTAVIRMKQIATKALTAASPHSHKVDAYVPIDDLPLLYTKWAKETQRNGKILIGSMAEFFEWLSLQPVSKETDIKNISQMGEQC